MNPKLSWHEQEKQQNKKVILRHAEVLFCENGFEKTSIEDIAKNSGFTKRTVYKHFASKEDLYFAVVLKGQQQMFAKVRAQMRCGKTGIEKMTLAVDASRDFFLQHEPLFGLMSQVKTISDKSGDVKELPHYQQYVQYIQHMVYDELFQLFQQVYSENENSTPKQTPKKALTILFQLMAFLQMYAIAGDAYVEYFQLNKAEFIDCSLKTLLGMVLNEEREHG